MVETTAQPVTALPRSTARSRTATVRHQARAWLRTTPGKLVVLAVLVVTGAVVFGAIAFATERSRSQAAHGVQVQTEPALLQSVFLYTALSGANATATATFLQGGLEPPARRARYLGDLRLASDSLGTLMREAGGAADTRPALQTITDGLPIYGGLVEAARANNRQGYPAGAAYLRQASALLGASILPRADQVYASEAKRLSDDYGTGTSTATLVVLIVAVVLALGLSVGAQVYLARMSRRVFNVPMLVATGLLVALSIWSLVGFIGEQNALARARTNSDAVEVLSASRVLLSRAQSDQSLILANRGSDQTSPADLTAMLAALSPPQGLMGEATAVLGGTGGAAARLNAEYVTYRAQTARVAALGNSGQIAQATRLGASDPSELRLDGDLSAQVTAAQGRFSRAAQDATSAVAGLAIAIPVLALLGAALAVFGIRQRLEEYR